MKNRLLPGLVLVAGLVSLPWTAAAPHPYYDDAGNVSWKAKVGEAFNQARLTGRLVFIHVCKENHPASEESVTNVLRDESLGKLLNRHFLPVAVDADKPPVELQSQPDLKKFFDRSLKMGTPFMMLVKPPNLVVQTLEAGSWTPKLVQDALLRSLSEHAPLAKQQEDQLAKQVESLEKALANKKTWPQATQLFNTITRTPGYTSVKDRAYDALEKASSEAIQQLSAAYGHARQEEYDEARKLIAKVQKEWTGLPIAEEAKAHQGALKLLESANKKADDPKMKAAAIKELEQLILLYGDTPYAALALVRKRELAPPPKK